MPTGVNGYGRPGMIAAGTRSGNARPRNVTDTARRESSDLRKDVAP